MAEGRVRVLTDECISDHLADILHRVGIRCIYPFGSQFTTGLADEEWVPQAASRGFVCLSCDRNMVDREQIAEFLSKRTARMIFLPSSFSNSRLRVQLAWLLKYWDKIEEQAASMTLGSVAAISKSGQIRVLYGEQGTGSRGQGQ